MNTFSTEDKEVTYAYNVIKEFFDDIDMYHAIEDTEYLIRSAAANKKYSKRNPGDLFFFKDRFEELTVAAFTIHNCYAERKAAILTSDDNNEFPDISIHKDFVPSSYRLSLWETFPRHITPTQYYNPYKAIKKFVSHLTEMEWKKVLKLLIEYALTHDTISDEYQSHQLIIVRLRMLQLIEACHLIYVRTILQAKSPKNKTSNIKKK